MPLTNDRKKALRNIGHNLKPIVTIGDKGLSEGVLEELNRALEDHELIKVKMAIPDRDVRKEVIAEMCTATGAELVQEIGKIALILRNAKKPNAKLSNLLRPC
ncbi:YhbY family RNA-binding protein [uncultured Microbulbifer sp.]|uniref:YhbY family RNA-binding protein n=1 Tax=uncultured Microbulbifer sp. TaxID=348147 RepID=UPI0025ED7980|nr:YhbY family RNA-binding protein [uncultured Microbulbifer sp.]